MNEVIAIGALGGSGTRAVAQILIEAGIYMGDDLNRANDNLIFTRLFKNPNILRHASRDSINKRFRIFEEYMESDYLTLENAVLLVKYSVENPVFQQNRGLLRNVVNKLSNRPICRESWGWKEPNTQLYIDGISDYFRNLKYVHVVRHGLDMAFSNNKQQLYNWGQEYDISLQGNETVEEKAYKQLEYWIRSTRDSLIKGQKLRENFLLINHSEFCQQPVEQVNRLIEFLNLEIENEQLHRLYSIPQTPKTTQRYRKYDIGIFDNKQIDFIKELGFSVIN